MALRDVFVRITGKEDVSAAAGKAGASLQSLGKQAKSLLENQLVQGIGFAGLVAGLGKAVDAANELEASTRKLEATAKITGVGLDVLQQISQRGQSAFKLNATIANDFAVELAKLASKAGDVGKAAPGMEAFLNLGAARGLSAAETLKAVQQSILGIDEGTDKLFGKNPSAIYAEFAATIGTTAGKLTDQQKAMSILTEAMEDGGKVRGEYARYLQSAAGQQEQLTNALKQSAAELGQALTPALLAVLPVITKFVAGLSDFVKGIQAMAIDAGFAFQRIAPWIEETLGKLKVAIGNWLSSNRVLMTVFGDGIAQLGENLANEGTKQIMQAGKTRRVLTEAQEDAWKELVGIQGGYQAKSEGSARGHHTAVTKLTAEELEKRKKAEEKHAKEMLEAHEKWNKESLKQLEDLGKWLGKETKKQGDEAKASAEQLADVLGVNLGEASAKALQMTTDAMERLLEKLRGKIPLEQWQALNAEVQQHRRDLSDLLPPLEKLEASVKEATEANKEYEQDLAKAKKHAEKLSNDSAMLARAFVDAASAAGIMDERMANVLNSAISLAKSLPGAFAGDPASIASAVTSLANIIVGIGSSPLEKKREANRAANTAALDRLTREVGNLNLREDGKTFAGIQTAVDASVQARADARAAGKGPGDADKAAKDAFLKSLRSQGIGLDEARGLFKELFGRDLSMADAGLFFQDIADFQQGLQRTEFGQFGSDFEGQLDALTKGFDILGTDDADDKLREFQKLVGKFSPALAKALAVDLSTPEGRAAATKNLQGLFEKLKTGGLTPQEIGVSGNQFLDLISTLLPLIADANGAGVPSTASSVASSTPNLSPGLPYTQSGVIGTPTVSGSIVPSPVTQTTTINGGLTIVNQFPNAVNAEEILETITESVDEALVRRYDNLLAARGTLAQTVTS
ncbi:MAG: hypothetical protein EKK62_16835 [Acidimicrobiia bacterium]|nr:MAG: hypothetical protein EKK62_16835 [Acidimicrobiia bacterium]